MGSLPPSPRWGEGEGEGEISKIIDWNLGIVPGLEVKTSNV
jgi:hypothetical protein